jgi:hypothetical protein
MNKKTIIDNYISTIDWESDKWDINNIKKALKHLIGEEPAIKINYEKEHRLNEFTGQVTTPIEKLVSLDVFYYDGQAPKKLEYKFGI